MNWTQFLIALSAVYLIYYTLIFLLDLFLQPSLKETTIEDHLLEYEEPIPAIVDGEPSPLQIDEPNNSVADRIISGEIVSSAPASFADLQRLAKDELIEYTKYIPY